MPKSAQCARGRAAGNAVSVAATLAPLDQHSMPCFMHFDKESLCFCCSCSCDVRQHDSIDYVDDAKIKEEEFH